MIVDRWELFAPGSRLYQGKVIQKWLIVRAKSTALTEDDELKYSEHQLCPSFRDALKVAFRKPLRLVKIYDYSGSMVFCTKQIDEETARFLLGLQDGLENKTNP